MTVFMNGNKQFRPILLWLYPDLTIYELHITDVEPAGLILIHICQHQWPFNLIEMSDNTPVSISQILQKGIVLQRDQDISMLSKAEIHFPTSGQIHLSHSFTTFSSCL